MGLLSNGTNNSLYNSLPKSLAKFYKYIPEDQRAKLHTMHDNARSTAVIYIAIVLAVYAVLMMMLLCRYARRHSTFREPSHHLMHPIPAPPGISVHDPEDEEEAAEMINTRLLVSSKNRESIGSADGGQNNSKKPQRFYSRKKWNFFGFGFFCHSPSSGSDGTIQETSGVNFFNGQNSQYSQYNDGPSGSGVVIPMTVQEVDCNTTFISSSSRTKPQDL